MGFGRLYFFKLAFPREAIVYKELCQHFLNALLCLSQSKESIFHLSMGNLSMILRPCFLLKRLLSLTHIENKKKLLNPVCHKIPLCERAYGFCWYLWMEKQFNQKTEEKNRWGSVKVWVSDSLQGLAMLFSLWELICSEHQAPVKSKATGIWQHQQQVV